MGLLWKPKVYTGMWAIFFDGIFICYRETRPEGPGTSQETYNCTEVKEIIEQWMTSTGDM